MCVGEEDAGVRERSLSSVGVCGGTRAPPAPFVERRDVRGWGTRVCVCVYTHMYCVSYCCTAGSYQRIGEATELALRVFAEKVGIGDPTP